MNQVLSESSSMSLNTGVGGTFTHHFSQAQGYLRPLGSFEELLWLMDKRSPIHASLMAHVDGETKIEQWKDALERTRRRHPLWSATIVETDNARPHFGSAHETGSRCVLLKGISPKTGRKK
jgi:hypothetical protein